MTNHYETELEDLGATYSRGLSADISGLKAAIAAASDSGVIGLGSGGSFTVASLLCNLHEAYTGRISRPTTPLEIICNPTLASTSPVILISSEGNNPDITEALVRAREQSSRPIHILTNFNTSKLTALSESLSEVRQHVFALDKKDGYLATNSLLLNAVLVARTYAELDHGTSDLPGEIEALRVGGKPIKDWLEGVSDFTEAATKRGAVIVVYSPQLRATAADLESKLAEAALAHCQLADVRSFAHGRHLWLAERNHDCVVLGLTEPSLDRLWQKTRSLLPEDTVCAAMDLAGSTPTDQIAGLVAQMHLVARIARGLKRDAGRPSVPEFGRHLYHMDLDSVVDAKQVEDDGGVRAKVEVLGGHWPSRTTAGPLERAGFEYRTSLEQHRFAALVCDYDGTLCASNRKDLAPSKAILERLCHLLESGIIVGIASGRGGSLQVQLQKALPAKLWDKVPLGLYNGGHITTIGGEPPTPGQTSEFLSHVTRIVRRLKALGAPIESIHPSHPHQVSIRCREGVSTERMWFVVADALREAGLKLGTMVRSKHSIDVLAEGISKSRLVGWVIQQYGINPYSVLTMGDLGAWPGNDAALLEHKFSLSVDAPSRRLDRGWKFAPAHKRDVDAALWYLDRMRVDGTGAFKVSFNQPSTTTL